MDWLGVWSPDQKHYEVEDGQACQNERDWVCIIEADEDDNEGEVVYGVVDGILLVHEHGEDAKMREDSIEQNER